MNKKMAQVLTSNQCKRQRVMSRGPNDDIKGHQYKDSLTKFRFSGSMKRTQQPNRPPRTHQSSRPHHNKVNTSQAFSAFGNSEHPTSARITDSNCLRFENQIIKETYEKPSSKTKEILVEADSIPQPLETLGCSIAMTESQSKQSNRGSTGAPTLITDRAGQKYDNEI